MYTGRKEVTGERGKMRNKELRNLYSLADIIWAMESRGMRWAAHVARVGEKRYTCRLTVGKLRYLILTLIK
jgi:hypothetical protein